MLPPRNRDSRSLGPGSRGTMRTVVWCVVCWLGLAALWLLYQGEWNAIQIYAAISAGALSTIVAAILRRHARPRTRIAPRFLRSLLAVPWQVLSEFVVIARVLVRAAVERRVPTGEFRAVAYATGGERPAERGRRAFLAMVVGYAPNSYVIDIDTERKVVLLHLLSPVPQGEELP
jgi:multisubunit Na+/H+ antiporter MnhE subunit